MGPELRLSTIYLVFVVFLAASAVEDAPESLPVTTERLALASGEATASSEARLATALGTALRRLGFSLTPAPALDPWAIVHRGRRLPLVWTLSHQGSAETVLERAGLALAQVAQENGARVLSSEWEFLFGHLCLRLTLDPDGRRDELPLCLLAEPAKVHLARVMRRPESPEPKPTPVKPRPRPEARRPRLRVAIVLDDVGTVAGTEKFLALPARLTIAVLPFTRYGETYARQAASAGRTVILHLPLESTRGADPGPGVIRTAWSKREILAQLEVNLKTVPGAVGVNNHMGSLGTADEDLMTVVLSALKRKGLFFLDSRTGKGSAVERVARRVGERYAVRDVFLDSNDSVPAIQAQLRRLIALARQHGSAIGICHANRTNTLAALAAMLPEFEAAGIEIVPVTELIQSGVA